MHPQSRMMDKLNTAEYDPKGRCVRHPAIRLRKKKLFGGWKVIIGHCPECCLDEMRRVRDEIGAEQDSRADSRDEDSERQRNRHSRHKKKKKHRNRERDNRDRHGGDRGSGGRNRESRRRRPKKSNDSVSEASGGPGMMGSSDANFSQLSSEPIGMHYHHSHPPQQQAQGGAEHMSEGTGSTAPNSSMEGNGSVVSEQMAYNPRYQQQHYHHRGGGGGGGGGDQYYQQQQQQHSPPPQRTMVLSMAFTDPQTGQRGTYTGQVNSINHKPDGKGTVYYANGTIAEGTWTNGMLVDNDEEDTSYSGSQTSGSRGRNSFSPTSERSRSRSTSRGPRAASIDPPQASGRSAHGGSGSGRSRRSSKQSGSGGRGESAPPTQQLFGSGNLDQLDRLGGKPRRVPRGASASVQSYNSRGSATDHGYVPSGSASVQLDYGSSSRSFHHQQGGGGGGVAHMGAVPPPQFQRRVSRGGGGQQQQVQQQQSSGGYGRAPPGGYR